MAKWILKRNIMVDDVTCSQCGAREDAFVTRSLYGGEWAVWGESLYCPTCGARMTGKEEVRVERDDEDFD